MNANEVTSTMRQMLEAASRKELELLIVRKTVVRDKQRKYKYGEWLRLSPYLSVVRRTSVSVYYQLNRSGEVILEAARALPAKKTNRGRGKIDEHTIRAIRSAADDGEAYTALAEKYSVSASMIRNIALRVSYKEIK
jgi:hypothetical protein